MEFVFLSSGEIRAREDCPPGLALPMRQPPRLEYAEDSEQEEDREAIDRKSRGGKMSRQQSRRRDRQNESFSSSSEDADVLFDEESDMSSVVLESKREMQATRNAESHGRRQGHSVSKTTRNGVKNTPNRSLKLDHLRSEEGMLEDRHRSAQRRKTVRDEKPGSSETTPRESRQRPTPLEQVAQVSQLEDTHDVPTRRTKRSPKMEVSHLTSEEPTPTLKDRNLSTAREEKMIERLEMELQKEKKRVLEKMTQLLDEQGKNQQLHDRVQALEAQLAMKDTESSTKARNATREQGEQTQPLDNDQTARVNTLEEQVRLQETKIARLKRDKDQLKSAVKQLKQSGNDSPHGLRSDDKESAVLKAGFDDITQRLHEFLASVEHWKSDSKDTLQSCHEKSDLPALLERLWLDFPQFPGIASKQQKKSRSPTSEQQQQSSPGPDEQADVVLFLKKRLRQREDELRQTHVKYVELKELCARQCVREADLQNFINEHRLRGNLIIRKNSGTKPNGTVDNQTKDDPQDERQPSAKLKMISSRGTNTPASYNDRGEGGDNFVNDEYSDNQEDNDDDYEEGDDEEYEHPVRTPKVFVQVGRDGVYEHASPTNSAVAQKLAADWSRGKRKPQSKQQQQRVERIRLVPSPSLAQRYERVPTPTTTAARRKKSAQQPVPQQATRHHPAMFGECPPGCGSRLSFTHRKTPTAAARSKPVKRPVAATATKGAIGVIRPWM
ncbi:unnamed protein product [Phytophthora lilii]|uniref:Unnamed protein product n=1 Tax=Phytophthora lilii TaxID=2077276 RepID=A0A9W6THW5_9STRA|nr:unnamed protein product [Phytophthora lilii]